MAVDYTGSGHETRRQYLVRTVAPQVDAVEQPVQLIDRQLDGLVAGIGLGLEAFGFQTLEPQAEAIALPVEDLDLTAGAVEEHEQHGVEHFHLDVQLDQSGQAVDGFAEIDGLWVEIDLLHLGVGTHHDGAPREKWGAQHPGTDRSVEGGVYGAVTANSLISLSVYSFFIQDYRFFLQSEFYKTCYFDSEIGLAALE